MPVISIYCGINLLKHILDISTNRASAFSPFSTQAVLEPRTTQQDAATRPA